MRYKDPDNLLIIFVISTMLPILACLVTEIHDRYEKIIKTSTAGESVLSLLSTLSNKTTGTTSMTPD